MICPLTSPYRRACLRAVAGALLLTAGTACAGDKMGPSPEPTSTLAPSDSALITPSDSTTGVPVDSMALNSSSALLSGIAFGVSEMPKTYFSTVYTGTAPGGALDPSNMLGWLSAARAKGARVVVKLSMGRDLWVQNSDKTFSLTKWKALVDRYKSVNFASYIADGTVLGHYLIDEPSRPERWGGKIISQATIEAMAAYSKKLWPAMPTLVRVVPSWLASAPVTYTNLDAAWFQYAARFGDPAKALAAEVAVAKRLGLGLVTGMNVLDGGNGSSRIPGWSKGKWAMSASEIRSFGAGLLSQSYICGFFTWMWDVPYYGRADVTGAMTALSTLAKAHPKTSCRQ